MKFLRQKGGYRRETDRTSFAFFVVGAIVVIAVAFFIGLQVGRVMEKNAAEKNRANGRTASQATGSDNGPRAGAPPDIRREMDAFSEEASRVPAVPAQPAPAPTAGEELRQTERSATFPESLSRKDPSPQPLVQSGAKPAGAGTGDGRFTLQAGAMKNRETAEAVRRRLETAGYKAKVAQGKNRNGEDVYRVRVGPYDTREAAAKAMKTIRDRMKIDVILLKG
ncbi:MAG TPA: SPOR domain-containing protein [Candidatus Deferrimicrobiaceae bacterium]